MLLRLLLLAQHATHGDGIAYRCAAFAACQSVAAFNGTLKQTAACVHKHRTHATAYAHLHTHTHTHTKGGGSKDNNNSRRPGCGRLLSDFNTLRMKIAKRQRRGVDNYPLIA